MRRNAESAATSGHGHRRSKDSLRADDWRENERWYPTANLSDLLQAPSLQHQSKGRCAMARADFASLPQGNPCAQCSKPIALPGWVEAGPRRISYLWHCRACDYRFEAVAFFDEAQPEALAA
jgi:hypothetical protein